MIPGLAILFAFQLVGELGVRAVGVAVPGNVAGMALLVAALGLGVVRLEWVKPAADLLLRHLPLFFVPAGVGVMVHRGVLDEAWLPITVAVVPGTLAVLAVTGWTVERVGR